MKIGFVGLGKMVFSMVPRLVRDVYLFNDTIGIDAADLFPPDSLK